MAPPLLPIGLVQWGHSPLKTSPFPGGPSLNGCCSNLVMPVPPYYWSASPCGQPLKQGPQGRLLECEVPERPQRLLAPYTHALMHTKIHKYIETHKCIYRHKSTRTYENTNMHAPQNPNDSHKRIPKHTQTASKTYTDTYTQNTSVHFKTHKHERVDPLYSFPRAAVTVIVNWAT